MTPDELRDRIAEAQSREAGVTEISHDRYAYWQHMADAVMPVVREAVAAGLHAQRLRLVQRVIAGDLLELSSEDRRRVLRWLEGQP